MKYISQMICRMLFAVTFAVATFSVNVTCNRKYYQEELDDGLDSLRKYKDE